jgi:cobalt-zinc-cadmium efflux system outer membrane protein
MHKYLLAMLCVALSGTLFSQQPSDERKIVEVTYSEAVGILLKESLPLLSSYYKVEASEGDLLQARAWNNPHFNWNQDMYSTERNEYFNQRNQRLIQLDVIFSVSGKHTRAVKMAKIGVELNELLYENTKRTLVYELGLKYHRLMMLQKRNELYTVVFNQFKSLIDAYEIQYRVGEIPGSELIRLKSELLTIQNAIVLNQNEAEVEMSSIRALLNLKPEVFIKTKETIVSMPDSTALQYETMIDHAEENRPDYLSKLKEISYQEMNTKLQHSKAVPDLLIGYQPHDKGSNYVRPYAGLVVEMDIPVFNRNQGNIAAAKANQDRVKIEADQAYISLQNEVSASLNKYYNSLSALSNYDLDFLRELEALNNNALENYNRKNLGILQYIDMQRTYIKTMAEYLGLQSEVLQRINDLEFTTGLTLYH